MAELAESPPRRQHMKDATLNSLSSNNTSFQSEDTEYTYVPSTASRVDLNETPGSAMTDETLRQIGGPEATPRLESQASYKGKTSNLRTARLFFVALCVMFLFQFAFVSGYTPSILSALETRYGLSSSQVAVILSAYDVGGLLAAIPVSYVGGSSVAHRPTWIGVGGLVMAVGSLVWALPAFFGGLYLPDGSVVSQTNATTNSTAYSSSYCSSELVDHPKCRHSDDSFSDMSAISLGVFILGHMISGMSGMVPFSLGPPYMQDGLPPHSFALYLGILYSTTAIGPVLGFGLGAACQTLYVDFFSYWLGYTTIGYNLTPSSPAWVGAWWLGYVVLCLALGLSSIPFFFFPSTLASSKKMQSSSPSDNNNNNNSNTLTSETSLVHTPDCSKIEETEEDDDMVLPTLNEAPRELAKDVLSLLKNPVWILNNLIFVAVSSPVNGFVAYLKKYMESMFRYDAPTASLLMGGILVPAAALGVGGGGVVNRKFGTQFSRISARHLCYAGLAGVALVIMMLVRCPNNSVIGVHVKYFSQPTSDEILSPAGLFPSGITSPVGLDNQCNSNCSCDALHYDPICGSDGMTYFSGCYAGCDIPPQLADGSEFSGCKCIPKSTNSTVVEKRSFLQSVLRYGTATLGACSGCLTSSAIFLAVTFAATLAMSLGHNGTMLMLLRSIPRSKRALSLGLHSVLFKLFAAVPAPLLFGRAVDSACIYSSSGNCNGDATPSLSSTGSYCLLYDANILATAVFGLAFGYCGVAVVFLIILFCYLMRRRWKLVVEKIRKGPRALKERFSSAPQRNSSVRRHSDAGSSGDPLADCTGEPSTQS